MASSFQMPKISAKLKRATPNGGAKMQVRQLQIGDFRREALSS